MATNYYGSQHYAANLSHNHGHHGRSRRGPRVSSQNHNRQFKSGQRSPKEVLPEPPAHLDYLVRFEAAKSFEFDDDEMFCPFHLLTADDLNSIHSASSSDRGSLSSGSPEGSPLQHQVQPSPALYMPSANHNSYGGASVGYGSHHGGNHMKLHQPMAQRTRSAIPIVDPASRSSFASPPLSVSPARQMQQYNRRF